MNKYRGPIFFIVCGTKPKRRSELHSLMQLKPVISFVFTHANICCLGGSDNVGGEEEQRAKTNPKNAQSNGHKSRRKSGFDAGEEIFHAWWLSQRYD